VKCDSRAPSAIHKILLKRIGINRFARDGAIARVRREHQLDPTRGWQSVWGAAEDGNGFVKKRLSGAVHAGAADRANFAARYQSQPTKEELWQELERERVEVMLELERRDRL
jgi:hypothetical protein